MKVWSRIVLLSLITVLAIPLAPVNAQESQEGEIEIAEDLSGFYTVSASSGTLVVQDDGDIYTLTLEGVPTFLPVVTDTPYLFAWRVETLFFAGNWAAAPDGLEASGVLEIDGVTLWLTLSAPRYDDESGTLTLTARVTGIYNENETKRAPKVPEAFEMASLFIYTNYDFESGMIAGLEARGGRFPRPDRRVPPRLP